MKEFDYYSKNKIAYPNQKDYIKVYFYDKGELIWSGNKYDYASCKLQLIGDHPLGVEQNILNEKEYNEHKKQYGEEEHKLQQEFINDLYEEFGVKDHPKREAVYARAYEYGHAFGYNAVYNHFEDLVDLIRD